MATNGKKRPPGRPKGSKNIRSPQRVIRSELARHEYQEPLHFLLDIANGRHKFPGRLTYFEIMALRIEAAHRALPYVRPRLQAVLKTESTQMSHEDWLRKLAAGPMTGEVIDGDSQVIDIVDVVDVPELPEGTP